MAATQILAIGSTAASSSDVTIADGAHMTLSLKGVTGPNARVLVELKDDAGNYNWINCALTSSDPVQTIHSPATFRVSRLAGATCGVFSG